MNIRFQCPNCDVPDQLNLPQSGPWRCVACAATAQLQTAEPDGVLNACALCGNAQLYRQKDFPQWLGMLLLAGACAAFFILQILYHQWLAWTVLLGSAAIDGLLYYGWVGDVVVCYRCGCQHRGIASRRFDPHELATAEKYRQERLRQEQLRSGESTS